MRLALLLVATYWLDLPLFPASSALLGLTQNPLRETLFRLRTLARFKYF